MSKTTIPTGGITADAIDATLIADDAISEEHLDATAITGHTALAEAPADTDEFLISDGGTLKRLDAQYVGSGTHVLVGSSASESATSSVNFDNVFSTTYSKYFISAHRLTTSLNNENVYMQFRTSGANQTSGAYNYTLFGNKSYNVSDGSSIAVGYGGQNQFLLTRGIENTDYQGGGSLSLWVFDPAVTGYNTRVHGTTSLRKGTSGDYEAYTFGGQREQTGVVHDGIRIYPSNGNFNQHRIYIYGVKDS